MMNYSGRLAVLQNKHKPQLAMLSVDGIYFEPNVFADYQENLVFMITKLYDEDKSKYKEPIIIFDASKETFACFETESIGGFYKIIKITKGIYEIKHEEFTRNRSVSKIPLIKQIHTGGLKWYPLGMLNELKQIVF